MFRTDNIYSLTDFQRKTKSQLARLKQSGQPEVLTINGQAEVVVQSASAYQELVDKLEQMEQTMMMLARADDRRILTRNVQLNIRVLQASKGLDTEQLVLKVQPLWLLHYNAEEINSLQSIIAELISTFEQADYLGSLIQIPPSLRQYLPVLENALEKLASTIQDYLVQQTYQCLMPLVKLAMILAQRYDAVITNPPYMGSKGMNADLKKFAKEHFPNAKSDLFAMFMEHGFSLLKDNGFNAQVNMQSWMFLSSYEKLRKELLGSKTIVTMAHFGARAFSQISGEVVQTTAWVLSNKFIEYYHPVFFRLIEGNEEGKRQALLKQENRFDSTQQDDFRKIPGSPIAYWVSDKVVDAFTAKSFKDIAEIKGGMSTSNNLKFLRLWFEVHHSHIGINLEKSIALKSNFKWFPYNKGGEFRKWYGNHDFVVNWKNNGGDIKLAVVNNPSDPNTTHWSRRVFNTDCFFKEGITWGDINSSLFTVRLHPEGAISDSVGVGAYNFKNEESKFKMMAFLNSKIAKIYTDLLCPTIHFNSGPMGKIPFKDISEFSLDVEKIINLTKKDWNTYETSWDFQNNPLIVGWVSDSVTQQLEATVCIPTEDGGNESLAEVYAKWQTHNGVTILEMQCLEKENNRLFIDAYGLQDELTPDVPLEQITLTINPKYRYGGKLSDEVLENHFQSDTLAELISYAIGCMMGRYSLDKAGLVYAHSGNVDFDTLYRSLAPRGNAALDAPRLETENQASTPSNTDIPHDAERLEMHSHAELGNDSVRGANEIDKPTFAPDDDGIIPLTDQEWFADDATHRLCEFVRVVWGEDNLQQNLDFVAESLCLYAIKAKSGESSLEAIRRYLSTKFYKDHRKTYKKRPIYWLFSSGKKKAFECLVYLHRYNESTLSRMRTEYVTPLLGKYEASAMVLQKQMEDASTTAESNRFKKSLTALEKKQTELSEFDDKLKHYADMRISLDLDDGVKVNYGRFGDLLANVKAVTGGEAMKEDGTIDFDIMPRICELMKIDNVRLEPKSYFNFTESELKCSALERALLELDRYLQELDEISWIAVKKEVNDKCSSKDELRGWNQLFELLNEVKGYIFLKKLGCEDIKFIPRSKKGIETPDLEALLDGRKVICEVKTINRSDFKQNAIKNRYVIEVDDVLSDGFLDCLKNTIIKALNQYLSYSKENKELFYIFIVINFDHEFDYTDKYFKQIDDFVDTLNLQGARIEFYKKGIY